MLRPLQRAGALLVATLIGLSACGGGGTSTAGNGVGSGGTGSYSNGPISGLGSIIVNSIRYTVSDSSTTVVRDDGVSTTSGSSLLKLGMLVEVSGGSVTAGSSGTDAASATTVRYGSAMLGPVTAVGTQDANGRPASVTVLGQLIAIDSKTVLPASLAVGDVIEVHALVQAASALTATLIEVIDTSVSSVSAYKVTGLVTEVSGRTFKMGQGGSVNVDLGSTSTPEGLRVGAVVRVWLGTTQSGGSWTATRVQVRSVLATDSREARLEGDVIGTASNQIVVNGVTVDTSRATVTGTLAVGARVEVKGQMSAGVLVASEVKVEGEQEIEDREVELHGKVGNLVLGSSFTVRGVNVAYTASVVDSGLTLATDTCVEVRGSSYDSSRRLVATRIKSDNDCRQ